MRGLTVLVVAAAALGCGRDAQPGSCMRARDGDCVEYRAAEAAAAKRMCAAHEWIPASCPREGRLGVCARDGVTAFMYAGPPNRFTAESATEACRARGGRFTPTP